MRDPSTSEVFIEISISGNANEDKLFIYHFVTLVDTLERS